MNDTAMVQKKRDEVAEADAAVVHTPRVDVLETDEELMLLADLPGVAPADVDIRFENGELTVHGRRGPRRSGKPWLWEHEPGNFHRVFRVTEAVAGDKIHAELKNGVLTVHLPKVEAVKPRRIAVKGE